MEIRILVTMTVKMLNSNKIRRAMSISLLLLVFSICSIYVIAAPPGGAIINEVNQSGYPDQAPGVVNVTSGNISYLNLSTTQQTFRWVGLYGNVTGIIKLGDSDFNTLFQWTAVGKYVFASTSNTISWTTINISNVSGIVSTYPYLQNGTDNYSMTFSSTGTIDSEILGIINNVPRALTYNSSNSPTWPTFTLTDGTSIIFTTPVNVSGSDSFNGIPVNYQMILPENGVNQDTTPTEYYMWVELA